MRRIIPLIVLIACFLAFAVANTAAQDSGDTQTHAVQPGENLRSLSLQYNVCMEHIKAANPELTFGGQYDPLPRAKIEIPTHAPECYTVYITTGDKTPLEIAEEFNICPEVISQLNTIHNPNATHYIDWYGNLNQLAPANLKVILPKSEPPCYNDAGQRLLYENVLVEGQWQLIGEYTDMEVYTAASTDAGRDLMAFAQKLAICPADLIWINASQVFIKEGARACDFVTVENATLYDISQEYNTCIETLMDVRSVYMDPWISYVDAIISIPQDTTPCYDENGKRLEHQDKTVHETQPNEFLIDIAEQYHVCIADLIAANEFIYPHQMHPPKKLFIPDVPLCENPRDYTLREGEVYTSASYYYNVCLNRIVDANPQFVVSSAAPDEKPFYAWNRMLQEPKAGMTLIIPERPPCYEMTYSDGHYRGTIMPDYVCYAQPIDFDRDYTGHEPVISPIEFDVKDNFCYKAGERVTTLIYQNEPLTIYRMRSYDTMRTITECLAVDLNEFIQLNNQNYAINVHYYGTWILPENYDRDCYLLTMTDEEYNAYIREQRNRAGYLDNDGIYVVNHQDTLSSIGKQFGYLPDWIAAENGLESPDVIFYLQALKMPSYPNYWQFAGIGGGILAVVGAGTLITGLLRWQRRKPKRKNEEV